MMALMFCSLFMLIMLLMNSLYSYMLISVFIIVLMLMMNKFMNLGLNYYKIMSVELMMDGFSLSLIWLTLLISLLMILSSIKIIEEDTSMKYFLNLILLLMMILLMSFLSLNNLLFYFYFEASLIPTFLLILGWGNQPERLQSGLYLLFYTLTASLPLLAMMLMLFNLTMSLSMNSIYFFMTNKMNLFLFLAFMMAFLVKMPMFLVHLWLPKAHVEAPVSGSMILAGVLLKLGGFGIYRFLYIIMSSSIKLSSYFYGLSMVGIILISFMCCRLNDMKALVAYSSVAHMALVISSMLGYYSIGMMGSLMMMVGHGISSSGLFCILNMIYEKTSSRSMYLNKGMLSIIPLFSFMFFMLCISNISAPPTLNLLAELMILISVMKFSLFMVMMFPLGSFMGAVFTLYMFSMSQHGKNYSSIYSFLSLTGREIHVIMIHVILLNLLILLSVYFF